MSLDFLIETANSVINTIVSSAYFTALTKGNTLRNVGQESAFILENSNLSISQKLIPATGVLIAGGAAIAALSSLVFGLPYWVPSIMFITSLGGFAYDLGFYLEEREEQQALNSQLISRFTLQTKINKQAKLSPSEKIALQDYSFGQSEIIAGLFQLRIDVINHKEMDVETKRSCIQTLNQLIEDINQDKFTLKNSLKKYIPLLTDFQHHVNTLNEGLTRYQKATIQVKKMRVDKDLLQLIHHFKATQRKIFTQDLPLEDKEHLRKILESKSVNSEEMVLILAKMGNHFVNHSSHWQIQVQDNELNETLAKQGLDEHQLKVVTRFYQLPRKIAHLSHQLLDKVKLDDSLSLKQKNDLIHHVSMLSQKLTSPITQVKLPTQTKSKLNKDILEINKVLEQLKVNYNNLNRVLRAQQKADPKTATLMRDNIIRHRATTLIQYGFGLHHAYHLPTLDDPKPKNPLVGTGIKKEFHAVEDWIETLKETLFNERVEPEELKAAKDKLHHKFKHQYGPALAVIQKAQRLQYLNHASSRHCLNVGFDVASSGLPLLLSHALAPASLVTAITYIYKAIPAFSAVNGIELALRKSHDEKNLNQGIVDLTEGVIPQYPGYRS